MKLEKINISDKFSKLPTGDYAVGLIAKMNNYDFKIVKFKGDFVWHSHPETDETFIIVEGTLVMDFRDRRVQVHAGEMIVIPKGMEHKPSSENGYKALLIEPEGVPNTGCRNTQLKTKSDGLPTSRQSRLGNPPRFLETKVAERLGFPLAQ